VIAGRFRLGERLGAGGMGEVYAAFDERDGREVALKMLSESNALELELLARFVREAQATEAARHANVVRALELVMREDGPPILVLERLSGETLEAAVLRGPLPARAASVLVSVLAALEAAHAAGVVHRDVKPANVFLCEDGTVKLMDFGIAKVLGERGLTRTGTVMGTPVYMAPEQLIDEPVDARTDVYGAGATLYEALTGRPPFVEDGARLMRAVLALELTDVRQLRPTIDPELGAIVHKALAKEPALRFQSATEMCERLGEWLQITSGRSLAPTAEAPTPALAAAPRAARATRTRTRRGRSRWLFALVPLSLLAAGAAGAIAAFALAPSPKHAPIARTLVIVAPPLEVAPTAPVATASAAPPLTARPAGRAKPAHRAYRFAIGRSISLHQEHLGFDGDAAQKRLIRYTIQDLDLPTCLDAEPMVGCELALTATIDCQSDAPPSVSVSPGSCFSPAFGRCLAARRARLPFDTAGLTPGNWSIGITVWIQ
jgi:hypothetical protein